MGTDQTAEQLRAELGAELRRRRRAAGLHQQELADEVGYSSCRAMVSAAENGHGLLPEPITAAIDRHLQAGGEILRLRARAAARERVERAAKEQAAGEPGEADTTDRRAVFEVAGGMFAAQLADRMATADPTPLTLAEIGAGVQQVANLWPVMARGELRDRIEPEHFGVESLLDRRLSRRVRDELTVFAGMYSYYLGWLAYDTGDDAEARAYLTVASHHAAECGDPLLKGSVAELRAGLAYFVGADAAAAGIAERARKDPDVHPYASPALAAWEARAAARLRQPERARAALADMEAGLWPGPSLPGPDPINEEAAHAWSASVLAELGEGEAAEGHARSSLALLAGTTNEYLAAGTGLALGRAFLCRRRPDPERAATATAHAVRTWPTRTFVDRASRTWQGLAGQWGSLPAVRDLGERVLEARKALPATA